LRRQRIRITNFQLKNKYQMKHKISINRLAFAFASVLLVAGATSCSQPDKRVDINCIYKGAIIYKKYDFIKIDGSTLYDIKYKGEILKYVEVYDIDNGYNVGDTVNRPCH
jgi:hypothetical protein